MKKAMSFSNLNRKDTLDRLVKETFDLVIIGGGITGGGIALDAASRGLKVALLEKGDFASGTSSKSTKLIHGGLRYLKQFDFWLVKEVGAERAIVHKLAPHLVLPEKMLLPLVEGGSYGKWLTSIGLKVYDILAQVSGDDKRQMLGKKEAMALEPLLPKKIVNGAGYYAEYRTDDARLTIENIKTSLQYDALCLNYAEVTDFVYENNQVAGATIQDKLSGETITVKSQYVISAAGPWVDGLRSLNQSNQGKHLYLTKGVHLVFPHHKLPVRQSVYFDVPDGRMIFAIPRGNITYVGTTDTPYDLDKDRVEVDLADALYLISAVNNMFPDIELNMEDIVSSWAGLRPLIHEEGKSASELSRKDEIFTSPSGLLSIAGGKLTGYRKMAERVVDRVVKKMGEEQAADLKECHTDTIPLCGNGFKKYKHVVKYIGRIHKQLQEWGFQEADAHYLVTTYGLQTDEIIHLFKEIPGDDVVLRMLRAELQFGIVHEMVTNPMDFFIRRTGRLYFQIETIRQYLDPIIEDLQQAFSYDETQVLEFRSIIAQEVERHSHFSLERASL
ncbi:MAG: glycerol-3-phosphate dehydrogenase/oxidase [Bacteroidota bacterium]